VEIVTSDGAAQAEVTGPAAERPAGRSSTAAAPAGSPAFLLVLTHGAGGGVDTPDLLAVRDAALRLGGAVAMVTQPYRVKGRRVPGSAARQDAAWLEVITALRDTALRDTALGGPALRDMALGGPALGGPALGGPALGGPAGADAGGGAGIPLIQGGRSNGARVACRTARAAGARAVVALAFPLHPPGRPERSRVTELRETGADVLVINGDRDPFGVPDSADATRVVVLAGESHALSRRPEAVADAVESWLREVLMKPRRGRAATPRASTTRPSRDRGSRR
jgi:predicted alpha/beta-hydrolase family hydrolase